MNTEAKYHSKTKTIKLLFVFYNSRNVFRKGAIGCLPQFMKWKCIDIPLKFEDRLDTYFGSFSLL